MSENMIQANSLKSLITSKKHFSVAESTQIFKELLKFVEDRHRKGDFLLELYPENIPITEKNGNYTLVVNTDKIHEQSPAETNENQMPPIASIGFRAPEVALIDYSKIGKQSDYYTITALFYYCLTGQKLSRLQMFRSKVPDIYTHSSLSSINSNTLMIIHCILKKGLAPELKYRYQSLPEIHNDLIKLEKSLQVL